MEDVTRTLEFKNNHFTEMCCGTEAGSYLRLIDSCITQLKARGPSRTCNESKEEVRLPCRATQGSGEVTLAILHGTVSPECHLDCVGARDSTGMNCRAVIPPRFLHGVVSLHVHVHEYLAHMTCQALGPHSRPMQSYDGPTGWGLLMSEVPL